MKAILMAGGAGSRLYPTTKAVNKHILPIYDKPMVYYPLSLLIEAGVDQVLLITRRSDIPSFRHLLSDGEHLGIEIRYAAQDTPRGIAEALLIGAEFVGDSRFALLLGDNVFVVPALAERAGRILRNGTASTIFSYQVTDAARFGVLDYNGDGKLVQIVEKPRVAPSDKVATGLYIYEPTTVEMARELAPSGRGELEITALNNELLSLDRLEVEPINTEGLWFDAGTPDGLLEASNAVRKYQNDHRVVVAAIEEAAWRSNRMPRSSLRQAAKAHLPSAYGSHLGGLLADAGGNS